MQIGELGSDAELRAFLRKGGPFVELGSREITAGLYPYQRP